jgi:hypothetical protein
MSHRGCHTAQRGRNDTAATLAPLSLSLSRDLADPGTVSEAARDAAGASRVRDDVPRRAEAPSGTAASDPPAVRQVVALQRLAGNYAVTAALQRRRATPTHGPDADPRAVLDQSVINGELAEVTAVPGVSATTSASGRNLLVPEQPPKPSPPRPEVGAPVAARTRRPDGPR